MASVIRISAGKDLNTCWMTVALGLTRDVQVSVLGRRQGGHSGWGPYKVERLRVPNPPNHSGQISSVSVAFNTKVCQSLNISKWLLFCLVEVGCLIAQAGLRLPQYLKLALNS